MSEIRSEYEAMFRKRRQRQDSLTDQLRDVAREAERMGCYDAADFIRLAATSRTNEQTNG